MYEKSNQENNLAVYSVKVSTEPKRKALRMCHSLGGIMKLPQNEADLTDLGTRKVL